MSAPGVSISDQLVGDNGGSRSDRIAAMARTLGFDAVGIARADLPLDQDIARYDAFVAAEMHGEMQWLAQNRTPRERVDGEEVLRGARSVVCVARRYQRPSELESADSAMTRSIARYARGRDYHKFLRRRLRRLATFIRSLGSADLPVHARPICDDAPVLERAWAARAGLGFVGKNGMLIVPGVGSFVLLGEVVTTLALDPLVPMTERCGACMRCLDACPTGAFVAPFVLDPRRCVAYLTIEHRSAIPVDLREGIGTHLFGCDDCQRVCPFNAGAAARTLPRSDHGDPFAPLERWSRVRLEDLLELQESGWEALSEGTPLKRAGLEGLARNAAIALGNRGDLSATPILRRAANTHPSPLVRDAAAWALARLTRSPTTACPPATGRSGA